VTSIKQTLENVNLINFTGVPTMEDIIKYKPNIIVIDDLMGEINSEVRDLFIRGSHHMNISIILIVQNLFNTTNKYMRTINLNTHYVVLMRGIRNRQQIATLGSQTTGPELLRIFIEATKDPFSYLVIDFHPRPADDRFRVRYRIFPEEISSSLLKFHTFSPICYDVFKDEKTTRIKHSS